VERAIQAKPYLGVAVDGKDVLGVAVLGVTVLHAQSVLQSMRRKIPNHVARP
jgi:hypothetical protein